MIKSLLMLSTIINFSLVTAVPVVLESNVSSDSDFREYLKKDIEENKVHLGSRYYTEFDGQNFNSQDSLNEHILSNSIIESEYTSSNPSKIIKDYEHKTLDSSKIYNIDMDEFVNLYRDAFGNIAEKSKDALATYTHSGLVRQKYSYDQEAWFDSPEEAKINQKDKMEINSSLYYVYENKYYNAFNIKDINNLLANFTPSYYSNRHFNLSGEKTITPILEYGKSEDFYNKMKDKLYDDFLGDYYYKVSEMSYQNSLSIGIDVTDYEFRIKYNGETEKTYWKGENPIIIFSQKFRSNSQMIDYYKSGVWKRVPHKGPLGKVRRYSLEKEFELINPRTKSKVIAKISLYPEDRVVKKAKTPNLENYSYKDNTSSKILTYIDKNKKELAASLDLGNIARYEIEQSTRDDKIYLYEKWFNKFFYKTLINFGNGKEEIDYSDILNEKFTKNVDETVYRDLVYDVNQSRGNSYSVIKSFEDWKKVKSDLKRNPVLKDGVKKYELRPDFYATEEQLDKFLSLQGKMQVILKYSYGSEKDISSPDGKLLADTYQEAREKQFINQNLSLKKKYIAYDVFGNSLESGNSEEEAIRLLQNKILLESKMVHKKEKESWNLNVKKSYDSIISDGRYLVYKVKDKESDTYIYYSSQEDAMRSVLTNAKTSADSINKVDNKYLYTYIDINSGKQYSVIFYNNEISSAIEEIISKIGENERILN